jgi:hypothetical protein
VRRVGAPRGAGKAMPPALAELRRTAGASRRTARGVRAHLPPVSDLRDHFDAARLAVLVIVVRAGAEVDGDADGEENEEERAPPAAA